jgi:hypothetical protein
MSIKYKIILKTTHKHATRVENCLKTWLKDLDYVCLTDNPTGLFKEISGSKRDDYYSAEEKTVYLINHVKQINDFDPYEWLVFIDDDAIVNIKMLEYILPHFDKTKVYGYWMYGFPKDLDLKFPSGGSGYFIPVQLIKNTPNMVDQGWGIEDCSVGKWIQENNLQTEDVFYVNEKKHLLRTNGWFPFIEESKEFSTEVLEDKDLYVSSILERVTDQKIKELKSHFTHHYVRDLGLMNYLHELYNEWTPSDLSLYEVS